MSAHLDVAAWWTAPANLTAAMAEWCLANGHHGYEAEPPPRRRQRNPYMLRLGIRELVEWLVRDGCSPALRALVSFPELEEAETIKQLWAVIVERHEFFLRQARIDGQ